MITNDPILAVMKALDTGVRTQATADLAEAGCRVQTSGNRGAGASHGADYWPVYACIARMERERPELAATIYTLFAPTEEESNDWLDAFHAHLIAGMIRNVPDWAKLRNKKRDLIEWLIIAAIVERRNDLERVQPAWGPEKVAFYLADQHGIRIPAHNWKRDWEQYWNIAQSLIESSENSALEPVSATIKREREKYRNELKQAA